MSSTPRTLLDRLRHPHSSEDQARDWSRFVDLYAPLLYTWALRQTRDEADAADLVQEVFLRLLRELPKFRYDPQKSFRAWLYTIVRHCWVDRQRRQAPVVGLEHAIQEMSDGVDPAHMLAEEEEQHFLIRRALELMERDFQPTSWHACWATVVEGRPAADVARELKITPAAVYAATARVLRRLREEMGDFLD